MEADKFKIEILEQGWLEGCSPEEDLCSHGRIKLTIGGQSITSGHEDYGISESALALLRTLASNHSDELPVAQRLIFHGCGAILMMACPIGIDWTVSHLEGQTYISNIVRYDTTNEDDAVRFIGLSATLPKEEYLREIIAFATKAKVPFEGITKVFPDDFDRINYERFWAEYDLLLEQNSTV